MYLSRLQLNHSRQALLWSANPYRVHQRLLLAFQNEPRMLFRIEEKPSLAEILVQSHSEPDWDAAFDDFPVLQAQAEYKRFEPEIPGDRVYHFRLYANPTVKKTFEENGRHVKKRIGLIYEADQIEWLRRKLADAGALLLGCTIIPRGKQFSHKNPVKDTKTHTHLAVLFEGSLRVGDSEKMRQLLEAGIGSAKGYGFGMLSLARLSS